MLLARNGQSLNTIRMNTPKAKGILSFKPGKPGTALNMPKGLTATTAERACTKSAAPAQDGHLKVTSPSAKGGTMGMRFGNDQ
jgi:hypothetical protein